jgi:hypothetical protein
MPEWGYDFEVAALHAEDTPLVYQYVYDTLCKIFAEMDVARNAANRNTTPADQIRLDDAAPPSTARGARFAGEYSNGDSSARVAVQVNLVNPHVFVHIDLCSNSILGGRLYDRIRDRFYALAERAAVCL